MTTTVPARTSPHRRGRSGEASAAGGGACRPEIEEEEEEEEKKRIAGYLHVDDEMEESSREGCDLYDPSPSALSAASSPPIYCKTVAAAAAASLTCGFRSFLIEKPSAFRAALFPWRGRHGKKNKKNDKMKGRSVQNERATRKMAPLSLETVAEGNKGAGCVPPRYSTSVGKPAEAYFNIGMGLGMACVLARWSAEFDKMTELRVQMEVLLKEIKQQIPTKTDEKIASSTSDWCREIDSGNSPFPQNQQIFQQVEGKNFAVESNRYSNCVASSRNKPKMEELEAELELELEQLQLNLEDNTLVHYEQEKMEIASESIKFCESFHGGFEPKDNEYNENCGVSARELERRLHEFLHTRHQEQIAELKAALQLTLVEREIEVSLWREAGMNASKYRVETFGEHL